MDILTYISLFATALLFGGMVFFAAFMTPLIFAKLDGDVRGQFLRDVFPWYYLTVLCLGAIAALAVISWRPVDGAILAGVAGVAVVVRQVLLPIINRARDGRDSGDAEAAKRFSRLHRLSVWINLSQMLAVAIVLARFLQP